MVKVWPGCKGDGFRDQNVFHGSRLLVSVQDHFWVARRIWLPWQISNKSWTFAIVCNFLSSASFFISELFSVFIVSNSGSAPAKILLLARANCQTTTFSRRVPRVVFDSVQPLTSRRWDRLASTPTPCGMMEAMLRATSERLVCLECVPSCGCHQSVMSSNQNSLLIHIASECHRWDLD